MRFRRKPAGVVEAPLGEGSLNLLADCEARRLRGRRCISNSPSPAPTCWPAPFWTATMAASGICWRRWRTYWRSRWPALPCACLQIDEANIPGNPGDGPLAAAAINRVLDAFPRRRAVHLCFGNYGGQTIQTGEWRALTDFLNELHVDHLVLEMAHRPAADLDALRDVGPRIRLGIGVVDVKVNHVETPERDRAPPGMRRARPGPRPRRLDPSRLRLLDAAALGSRPQNRGAGQRPRPLPGPR